MRIILKPGGVFLIILALGILVAVASRENAQASHDPGLAQTAANSAAAAAPTKSTLTNGDFESGFQAVQTYDNKAKLTGDVAQGWKDDSSWATVEAVYGKEVGDTHGGSACQRIDVRDVKWNGNNPNAVQFVQAVDLPHDVKYEAGIWMRSASPTPVEFSLRQSGWPFTYYGASTVTVGTGWTHVRVAGTPSKSGSTYIMVKLWKPGTVWLDDASVAAAKAS